MASIKQLEENIRDAKDRLAVFNDENEHDWGYEMRLIGDVEDTKAKLQHFINKKAKKITSIFRDNVQNKRRDAVNEAITLREKLEKRNKEIKIQNKIKDIERLQPGTVIEMDKLGGGVRKHKKRTRKKRTRKRRTRKRRTRKTRTRKKRRTTRKR